MALSTIPHPEPGRRPESKDARFASSLDWRRIGEELDQFGCAVAPKLLTDKDCVAVTALYDRDELFRSRVVMARHNFGRGEYKYFSYPLPEPVASLRASLYPPLAAVANRWHDALGIEVKFPATHKEFLARCHRAGQKRPTPLLLKYGPGDYNRLHQDLYGEHVFPLQATILLSAPGRDFTGGEFVLTEHKSRSQSRAEVVPLAQGDAVFFAVNQRPERGARGWHRAAMRHGVSRLRSGHRMTLGVIFHDAR